MPKRTHPFIAARGGWLGLAVSLVAVAGYSIWLMVRGG